MSFSRRKSRKHSHPGGLILDCRHWHRFNTVAKVGHRVFCKRCGEFHAVLFVIEPKVAPMDVTDPLQMTLDDIPPF